MAEDDAVIVKENSNSELIDNNDNNSCILENSQKFDTMKTSQTLLNDSVQDTENDEERSGHIKRVFKTAVVLLRCVHFWYDYDDHEDHDASLNNTNKSVSNTELGDNTFKALEDKAKNANYSNQNMSPEGKNLSTTGDASLLPTQEKQFQEQADKKLGSLRETSGNSQEINDNRLKEHDSHGNGNTQSEEVHNMDTEDNDSETKKQVPTSANRKMSTYLVQISALGGLKCHC